MPLMTFRLAMVLILAAVFLPERTHSQELSSPPLAMQISASIAAIKTAPDLITRVRSAQRLTILIRRSPDTSDIEERVIDEIAALLNDDSDEVRNWIVNALYYIGPPAIRSIPLLERALERRLSEWRSHPSEYPIQLGGIDSVFSICSAFQRIGETPPGTGCVDGEYRPGRN